MIGVIGTVATGKDPGFLLGFFVIAGSLVATLAVSRRRLYMLLPLPALVLFVGAVVAGLIHDRSLDTSTTELGVNFLQWIASVFFAMCTATILVLVIAGGRWLLSRQLVSGQFAMSAGRPAAARGPRPAAGTRPDTAVKPGLRTDGPRSGREPRDELGSRPPWSGRERPGSAGGNRAGGNRAGGNREQPGTRVPRGNPVPPDRDPWGRRDQRDGSDRSGSRTWRGDREPRADRPSWASPDDDQRNDRPRPTY